MSDLVTAPASEEAIFDAARYDLPIPKDRYGRKADKLVVALGNWAVNWRSEDDLTIFNALEKGTFVELRVRAFVTQSIDNSKTSEEGEDEVEMRRVLAVHSVELP